MNNVKNILVLQSRVEILVTVPGLGHGVPVSRKMFKTMRCFRTHAQRKRISGGAKGVRCQNLSTPIDFLFCCCLYKVFFFFSPCCV